MRDQIKLIQIAKFVYPLNLNSICGSRNRQTADIEGGPVK